MRAINQELQQSRNYQRSKESFTQRDNQGFLSDIPKLRAIQQEILKFNFSSDESSKVIILDEISNIAESIYRRNNDDSALRNKFSKKGQNNNDVNILFLDQLQLLSCVKEEKGRVEKALFTSGLKEIEPDLNMIASNIETILNRDEVIRRYRELTDGESIPKVDTNGITLAAQSKNPPKFLKSFIGLMFIPKTIEEIIKVLPLYPFVQYDELATTFSYITSFCYPFDMDSRIDRYSLARVFSIVGEHSNNISGLLPQGSHAHSFFASLNTIRNRFKTNAHKYFIADGNIEIPQKGFFIDLSDINLLIESFVQIDKNLKYLQLSSQNAKSLTLHEFVNEVYKQKLPSDIASGILKDLGKALDGKSKRKRRNKKKSDKNQEKFSKYCVNFVEESKRLQDILSYKPLNDLESSRKQMAIDHSMANIGESVRYLFEIDDVEGFFNGLTTSAMLNDIDETRIVRNQQLMHGLSNYNPEIVCSTAKEHTMPWTEDICSLCFILNDKGLSGSFFQDWSQDLGEGISEDLYRLRLAIFVGRSYFRLGQYAESYKQFEEVKSTLHSMSDESLLDEMLLVNNFLATLERKIGNDTLALVIINDSLALLECSNSHDETKANLLSNKATILSDDGDNKDVEELYLKAANLNFMPAVISFCQFLLASQQYDKVKQISARYKVKICEISQDRPYDYHIFLRSLWLASVENGDVLEAKTLFDEYVQFYNENIGLFKTHLGYNYKKVEAEILHDEASNLYCEGHYSQAIIKSEQAIGLLSEVGCDQSQELSHIYLTVANSYKFLAGKFGGSVEDFMSYKKLAIENFNNAINKSDDRESIFVGHAYTSLAEICSQSDRYKRNAKAIYSKHNYFANRESSNNASTCNQVESDMSFLREQLTSITDLFKSSRQSGCEAFRDALRIIKLCEPFVSTTSYVSPLVAELNYNKVICYIGLKEEVQAKESFFSFQKFAIKHPDCVDPKSIDKLRQEFKKSFKKAIVVEEGHQNEGLSICR